MKNIKIYQIYFDKKQRLDTYFSPVFNPLRSDDRAKYLETDIIAGLIEQGKHKEADYFGVVSYKFKDKTGLRGNDIDFYINKNEADIYSFFGHTKAQYQEWKHVNLWERDKVWHPLLYDIGVKLFDKLGHDIRTLEMPVIYYNYWIARSEIVEEFYNEILKPSIEIMETELAEMCMQDSMYPYAKRVDLERVKQMFGVPYFTYHPFVCERLFPAFVALKNKYKLLNIR